VTDETATATATAPAAACPHRLDRPVMRQRWEDVTFAHWPVPVDAVAAVLPPGLAPDLFAGTAWVSLIPFRMRDLRVRGLPPIPTTRAFAEVNVRTYVQGPEGPGVWFCSLDATHALPVVTARVAYGLPYFRARVDTTPAGTADDRTAEWRVQRRHDGATGGIAVAVEPGAPVPDPDVSADPLHVFLSARWRLYAGRRRLHAARVTHEPWPLVAARATSWDTGLVEAAGFRVEGAPIVAWSPGVGVSVERPRRLRRR
jgi:uncharacterized protein YqjF (DUF2071 family)